MIFYIFTSENIKYSLYFINIFLYFITLYIINIFSTSLDEIKAIFNKKFEYPLYVLYIINITL